MLAAVAERPDVGRHRGDLGGGKLCTAHRRHHAPVLFQGSAGAWTVPCSSLAAADEPAASSPTTTAGYAPPFLNPAMPGRGGGETVPPHRRRPRRRPSGRSPPTPCPARRT